MKRPSLAAPLGVVIAVVIVFSVIIINHPGWGLFSHTDCAVQARVGNITAWNVAAVVAAPFDGNESGSVTIWGSSPLGKLTTTQETTVAGGSVAAYWVGFSNFTIYTQANESHPGPGPEITCASEFVAYFSPNPAQGLRSGGVNYVPVASGLVADVGLPTQLNGSALCKQVENSTYASCAVGTQFDMNFVRATGSVNTCGQATGQVIRWRSQEWPVDVPVILNGQAHSVPIDPSGANKGDWANGTYAWYNYTFPANGGVWQYDNLSETSSTGAGLVFSYSACPQD